MTAVRQAAEVFLPEGIGLGVVGWVSAVVIGIPAAYGFIALLSQFSCRCTSRSTPLSLIVMFVFIVVVTTHPLAIRQS